MFAGTAPRFATGFVGRITGSVFSAFLISVLGFGIALSGFVPLLARLFSLGGIWVRGLLRFLRVGVLALRFASRGLGVVLVTRLGFSAGFLISGVV